MVPDLVTVLDGVVDGLDVRDVVTVVERERVGVDVACATDKVNKDVLYH